MRLSEEQINSISDKYNITIPGLVDTNTIVKVFNNNGESISVYVDNDEKVYNAKEHCLFFMNEDINKIGFSYPEIPIKDVFFMDAVLSLTYGVAVSEYKLNTPIYINNVKNHKYKNGEVFYGMIRSHPEKDKLLLIVYFEELAVQLFDVRKTPLQKFLGVNNAISNIMESEDEEAVIDLSKIKSLEHIENNFYNN